MIKKNWKQFKRNFANQCCQLICEVKTDKKPKYLTEDKYKGQKIEPLITYDYVEAIKKIIHKNNLLLSVYKGEDQKNIKEDIVNPDITFETNDLQHKTCFECKILGSNSKYINKGLMRFVSGKYLIDRNMPFYGMLGYVKDEKALIRYPNLKKSIKSKEKELFFDFEDKKKNNDNEVIFNTMHNVPVGGDTSSVNVSHVLHSWE